MAEELELKAAVPDADSVRDRLRAAGARPLFRGVMEDRRFDAGGRLVLADQVLRVRSYRLTDGRKDVRIGWKGPTGRSADGYKLREEIELAVTHGSAAPAELLEALGYGVTSAIDRYVEVFDYEGATLRLEWYPRMDVLIEVEGTTSESIERAVAATGLPRPQFSAEPLRDFVARYERRTGERAVLALAELPGEPPDWALG